MMRDGKALQMGTSHELGQNFSRAFDITFLNQSSEQVYAWQTSWGVSTRLMGALVMAHGDNAGLRLPPAIAAVQVAVVLVRDEAGSGEAAATLADELRASGVRTELDARTDTPFGRRAVDWELKGVPVRLEVGPRELAEGSVVLVRRDAGTKTPVPLGQVTSAVSAALDAAQRTLLDEATALRHRSTAEVSNIEDAVVAAQSGFAVLPAVLVGGEGEALLNQAGVSVRCLQRADGSLPLDDDPEGDLIAVVAKAY
jgi:prolyl-tRNA synthetase